MSQSPFFWKCWQCGGQHPTFEPRCPNGSPVYDGAPTRAAMVVRWQRFAAAYSAMRSSWADVLKKEMRP